MRSRVLFVALVLMGVGVALPSGASPPRSSTEQKLGERLAAFEQKAGVREVAGDALGQARRALARAGQLDAAGEGAAATRARQIAAAALLVAERKVALAAERRALRGARARLAEARERAAAARASLAKARAAHQRAEAEAEGSGAPEAGSPAQGDGEGGAD